MNVHITARKHAHSSKSVYPEPVIPLLLRGIHTQQGAVTDNDSTTLKTERNRNSLTAEFFLDPVCLG